MKRVYPEMFAGLRGISTKTSTPTGETDLYEVLASIVSPSSLTLAQAQALAPADHAGTILVGGLPYVWNADSLLNDATGLTSIRPTSIALTDPGRFLPMLLGEYTVALPITYQTADAAVLYTVPTGVALFVKDLWWQVTTGFTGGSSSAIGVSSSNKSGVTTKGDLLGGAAGDVAATLVAGTTLGTIGTTYSTLAERRKLWVAGDTIRFDRIISAFTAGAGSVIVQAQIVALP